jgi:hypothetical protein
VGRLSNKTTCKPFPFTLAQQAESEFVSTIGITAYSLISSLVVESFRSSTQNPPKNSFMLFIYAFHHLTLPVPQARIKAQGSDSLQKRIAPGWLKEPGERAISAPLTHSSHIAVLLLIGANDG